MVIPALKRLANCLGKVLIFLLLLIAIGRTLGDPYTWVNPPFADKVADLVYGYGNVGGEEIDDTYFYIGLIVVIAITTAIYFITMKLIKKIRS